MVDGELCGRDGDGGEEFNSSQTLLVALDQFGGEEEEEEEEVVDLRLLYAAQFLGRWGAGMWDFLVALLLMRVGSNSLLLTAAYGLVQAAATSAFGAAIGSAVDKISHIKASKAKRLRSFFPLILCDHAQLLRLGIGTRNVSIALSATALSPLLIPGSIPPLGRKLAIASVHSLGAVGILSGLAVGILLERDWSESSVFRDLGFLLTVS
ncbi:solute carrier family 40 member 2 [Selaginella moellendorffii]|uniref:solute carrier family 40 member 2 n=1 Tax=Selaginella moellendorffii TaxID=88036 RepID=UPI000D1C6573|nr:solute carrier family 40 member 2 [Selaginella moellendorffii]|eukprot:XP_024529696.1 solute carrier family 40 member 2 [Selaginella moellendorffii]